MGQDGLGKQDQRRCLVVFRNGKRRRHKREPGSSWCARHVEIMTRSLARYTAALGVAPEDTP